MKIEYIEYNDKDRRIKLTLPDGSYWEYTYDAKGQVSGAKKYDSAGNTAFADFDYSYDGIGNLTSEKRGVAEMDIDYTANNVNQYTARIFPNVAPVTGSADAAATVKLIRNDNSSDPDGQHLVVPSRSGPYFKGVFTGIDNAAADKTISYSAYAYKTDPQDSTKQLVNKANGSFTVPKQDQSFTYDDDGNLTSDGYWTYTWNAENRLIVAEKSGVKKLEFTYDYLGRWVEKKVYSWVSDAWSLTKHLKFVYNGFTQLAEYNALSGTDTLAKSYTWSFDSTPLWVKDGANYYYYVLDGNKNVRAMTDDSGTVASYDYNPFGIIVASSGTYADTNAFRFSSEYHDTETTLVYYNYRYYSPTLGRWLNRDPIEEAGGANLYNFVSNNPVGYIDALGLVLYAFDGTNNDRKRDKWGAKNAPNSPTNIAILVDLYTQGKYYESGVGTNDGGLNTAGNLHGYGIGKRLERMMKNFETEYKKDPNHPVDIIGFSRGAATARIFANKLKDKYPKACVRFLGIFDTVAQVGAPDVYNYNNGYDLDIGKNVGYVAHAVARNEYRTLFPLSSISKHYFQSKFWATMLGQMGVNAFDPDEFIDRKGTNYYEKAFDGAHSDIGGGYKDYRNLKALEWMIKQGQQKGVPFRNLEKYRFKKYLKDMKKPHESNRDTWYYWNDYLEGDRVIFPGNL